MTMRTTVSRIALAVGLAMIGTTAAQAQGVEMKFEHVMNIGSVQGAAGHLEYPEDMAIEDDGMVYVTDAADALVQLYDKKTGELKREFGGKGEGDENLEKPEGIALGPDDTVYVADYETGYVKHYSSDNDGNKWIMTFSEYGTGPGQNFQSEFMSIFDGRLYLPEVGNQRVDVFGLDGKFQFSFGGPGTGEGQFNKPESAKVNSEGKIFVADLKNDRIQVFDKDGKFLFTFGTSGAEPGQLKAPAGIAFDKNDNVFVTEIGNDRISVFDKNGTFLTTFGTGGTGDGQFENLHGIAIDPQTGWIYVCDSGNKRVQVFKPASGSSAS